MCTGSYHTLTHQRVHLSFFGSRHIDSSQSERKKSSSINSIKTYDSVNSRGNRTRELTTIFNSSSVLFCFVVVVVAMFILLCAVNSASVYVLHFGAKQCDRKNYNWIEIFNYISGFHSFESHQKIQLNANKMKFAAFLSFYIFLPSSGSLYTCLFPLQQQQQEPLWSVFSFFVDCDPNLWKRT